MTNIAFNNIPNQSRYNNNNQSANTYYDDFTDDKGVLTVDSLNQDFKGFLNSLESQKPFEVSLDPMDSLNNFFDGMNDFLRQSRESFNRSQDKGFFESVWDGVTGAIDTIGGIFDSIF